VNANLYSHIQAATPSDQDTPVLTTETGRAYSWRELHLETARYASLLTSLGLGLGDRVAAQVDKSPQALFLYLACLRAGFAFLPLNTAYQRGELKYFLGDAQPRVVVCRPQTQADIRELADAATILYTMDDAGRGTLVDAAAPQPVAFETVVSERDDLATIIYTSGTTGRSKGAMVTHGNLVSNGLVLVSSWEFTERDVLLHALPIFHVHGLFVANHCVLLSGARMIWHRKFDAAAVCHDLPAATVLMGVPTFYSRLLAEQKFDRTTCRSIRLFVSGSAPLLVDTFRQFETRTGQRILERYGMSEAGMITSNPLRGERKAGTVGPPLPGVSVRASDDQNRPLPTGQTGAIQIKGENVFKGYWKMPEKTREDFTSDGWFRTGDIGVFDSQGYLSIVGRTKDLIITGGYNVYPKEIELVLDALPGVSESAVIGLPHPDFGEAVTAVLVAQHGVQLDESAIIAKLKRELANYKVPKRVIVLADLPRNAMGKVQKNVLRQIYAANDQKSEQ
jgi:malonyl-CoA/methylmalonyl-CoA synthetase